MLYYIFFLSAKCEKQGYGAVHHSDIYRNEYFPAYRVIENRYIKEIKMR
jgi:hypothetical protein